jgi:transcriptional regulator of acetoin/glycerol metabolism
MLSLRAAVETAQCWRRFIAGAAVAGASLRKEIRESWIRSKAAGVNPLAPSWLETRGARAQHRAALADGTAESARLLAVSEAELGNLAHHLAERRAIIALADARGRIIAAKTTHRLEAYASTSPSLGRGKTPAGLLKELLGLELAEADAGTNCVGLSLTLGRPTQVIWHENYAAWAHQWAGFAAPIGEPALGVLAIIGCGHTPVNAALELASSRAQELERKLSDLALKHRLNVLEEFARYQARHPERPLLALSGDGRILGFSPAMSKLLGSALSPQMLGQRLSELAGFKLDGELAELGNDRTYEATLLVQPKNGSQRVVETTVHPLGAGNGDGLRAGFLLVGSGAGAIGGRGGGARASWRPNYGPTDFVGQSEPARQVLELVNRAAAYDWPVVMVGESGTGKELLAAAIHGLSPRAAGPFVALDCSTIPSDLVASELFGYEEGTFTGAQRGGKAGKLELADGGTLFLDELADLPLNVQAGLLRFLEDRKVVPLGGQRVKTIDARVIVAINTDPHRAVAEGKLRFDLYHRLNVFKIAVPPLRERREDIPLLARNLLAREGFSDVELSADALSALSRHSWPGNVRELRNVVLRAVATCANGLIRAHDLVLDDDLHRMRERVTAHRRSGGLDKEQILQALEQCGWNKSHAAKLLSVHWVTLHRAMQRMGIGPGSVSQPEQQPAPQSAGARRPAMSGELEPDRGREDTAGDETGPKAGLRQRTSLPMQPFIGPARWWR